MKTTFVTAIYNNFRDLGGRSRKIHYLYSIKSLLKMTDAHFIIYTSSVDFDNLTKNLKESGFENYEIRVVDMEDFKYFNILKSKGDGKMVQSLMWQKHIWVEKELKNTGRVYWIDAGLSHCGIIPNKYLVMNGGYGDRNYNSTLFNNKWLKSLNTKTQEKVFCIFKENYKHKWSKLLPDYFYTEHLPRHYFIGGFWGGDNVELLKFILLVNELADKVLDLPNIYKEELLYLGAYLLNSVSFHEEKFDIWQHENNFKGHGYSPDIFKTERSFYRVLEDFQ